MGADLTREREWWGRGYRRVAGLDEVGRGALAGPVVAGAVMLPPDPLCCAPLRAAALRDSKRLTARQREHLVPLIQAIAVGVALGTASAAEVDAHGIVGACRLAMTRALNQLPLPPDALLLDAFPLPTDPRPQEALVRADDRILSVAAASVVAKVFRDRQMAHLAERYPGYGLARNKGYGAQAHRTALLTLGATPIHRHSWRPIRELQGRQLPLPAADPDGPA